MENGWCLDDTLHVEIKSNKTIDTHYKNTRRGRVDKIFQNSLEDRQQLKKLFIWTIRKGWKIQWKNDPYPANDPEEYNFYIEAIQAMYDTAEKEVHPG